MERWVPTDDRPTFDRVFGLALTPDGNTPFVILHQYDRSAEWVKIIEAKYKATTILRPDPRPTDQAIASKPRYAADGLTIDWFDTHPRR
jgi:hypothetical protein